MNRRGFLQAFLAAAAAPVVGRLVPAAQQSVAWYGGMDFAVANSEATVWVIGAGGKLYDMTWDNRLREISKTVSHKWNGGISMSAPISRALNARHELRRFIFSA